MKVFCYETREQFDSLLQAWKHFDIGGSSIIKRALDNPNRTAGGYHWCTSLDVFEEAELSVYKPSKCEVYCYETKEKFDSIVEASKKFKVSEHAVRQTVDNPNRTASGHHFCTSLDVFDGKELSSRDKSRKEVYCYETREKFSSIRRAIAKYKCDRHSLTRSLDTPTKTVAGYHWCTSLDVFEGIDLYSGVESRKVPIFCYETKEKFSSISEVKEFAGNIFKAINKIDATAGGLHWCTDLSIFDGKELIYLNWGTSSFEGMISDHLKSKGISVIENSRKLLGCAKELDIYLPDYGLAIEFNGTYWHSLEAGKDKRYHQEKTLLGLSKGIEIIQVYQHLYIENEEFYLNYILDRINNIDRPDVELDSKGNHILDFCNKKYFTGNYKIKPPRKFSGLKNTIYDSGRLEREHQQNPH